MKKIALIAMVFAALTFASCGNNNAKKAAKAAEAAQTEMTTGHNCGDSCETCPDAEKCADKSAEAAAGDETKGHDCNACGGCGGK